MESRDLAFNLAASLLNSVIQACNDTQGYSIAFKNLAPSMGHNADWCLSNSVTLTGRPTKGIDGLLEMMNWSMNMASRCKVAYRFNSDGDLVIESEGCRTCGNYPLMCDWWCQYEFSMMCDDSNPDLSLSLEMSMSKGDDVCRWKVRRRDGMRLNSEETEPSDLVHKVNTRDMLDFWAMAGTTENAVQATSCLVQAVGKDKAIELLLKRANEAGRAFWNSFLSSGSHSKGDVFALLFYFDRLLSMQRGTSRQTGRTFEEEIISCPFSDVSPYLCIQIEEFKRGVLGALLPDQDWTFLEKRVEGGSCILSLTVNPSTQKVKEDDTKTACLQDELMGVLKMRLVKGEISESEYDKLLTKIIK